MHTHMGKRVGERGGVRARGEEGRGERGVRARGEEGRGERGCMCTWRSG